jgi:hypothetical protein
MSDSGAPKNLDAYEAELEKALSRAESRGGRGTPFLSDLFKVALGVVLGAASTFLLHWGQSLQDARIKRIDDQVSKLYGPLAVLSAASNVTWDEFERLKILDFDSGVQPDKRDIQTYRTWLSTSMLPISIKIEDVITGNAGLLLENRIPDRFKQWIVFTESYRAKAASWHTDDEKQDNYQSRDANVAPIDYPDLADCVSEQLTALIGLRESLEHRLFWLAAPDPPVPTSCNAAPNLPLSSNKP